MDPTVGRHWGQWRGILILAWEPGEPGVGGHVNTVGDIERHRVGGAGRAALTSLLSQIRLPQHNTGLPLVWTEGVMGVPPACLRELPPPWESWEPLEWRATGWEQRSGWEGNLVTCDLTSLQCTSFKLIKGTSPSTAPAAARREACELWPGRRMGAKTKSATGNETGPTAAWPGLP